MNTDDRISEYASDGQIKDGSIDMDALTEEEINGLIRTELDVTGENGPDMTLLNKYYTALDRFHNYDELISKEKFRILSERAAGKLCGRKGLSPRKVIAALVAATILLMTISIASYTYYNPFSEFIDNIQDIRYLRSGEVITKGNNSFSIDKNPKSYSSLKEAGEAIGTELIDISNDEYPIESISLVTTDADRVIRVAYRNGNIHASINLTSKFPEKERLAEVAKEIIIRGEYTFYIIYGDDFVEAVMFDGDYDYIYVSPDYDTLMNFIKGE